MIIVFSNSLSFLFLLSLHHLLYGRRNSDSEDEDLGSDRSSSIFSRIQKAKHRLDSNCQRRSLLLELATKGARSSRNTHAARRTSGSADEPRCTCVHEPACCLSLAWDPVPAAAATLISDHDVLDHETLFIIFSTKA